MDSGTIIQIIESIGLPSALSIYLLYLSNKHVEKYEVLIERITGNLEKIYEHIKSFTSNK